MVQQLMFATVSPGATIDRNDNNNNNNTLGDVGGTIALASVGQ